MPEDGEQSDASSRSPLVRQREDARRNRERIVVAAEAAFRQNPRASIERIASTAGVSRSTLYRHFQTREDLMAALADRAGSSRPGRGAPDVRLTERNPGQGLILAAPPGAGDLEETGLAEIRPAGQLGTETPLVVDATHVLNEVPPHLVAEQLVAEAQRIAHVPVALYVIDVDGSYLRRLAGGDEFPYALEGPLSVGPEIAPDALPELYARLERVLPDCHPYPMWLRGRAIGVLLAVRRPRDSLGEIARQGTAALEIAGLYTDAFEVARRRRTTSAAAEVQLNLLPPRNARVAGGELAGSLLPTYEVGGDWFDYVENRDGTWLAIAESSGNGLSAAAFTSVGLGALRAARRRGAGLDEAVGDMDRAVRLVGGRDFYLSAVVAHWHAPTSTLGWVSCGHIAPLLWATDGRYELLTGRGYGPLGRSRSERTFERRERRLRPGERLILYTGGVTGRTTSNGDTLGLDGIAAAVTEMQDCSAAATTRNIQEAVAQACAEPLTRDAAVVVLAVH